MTINLEDILRSDLSERDVKDFSGFTRDIMVQDYLQIGRGGLVIAAQVNENEININLNRQDIDQNTADIAQNTQDLSDHEAATTVHGVTGNAVGTEDFCTASIGGVALLAALVADVAASTAEVTAANAPTAAAVYSQSDTQVLVDLTDDIKAKHNQMLLDLNAAITQINTLLAELKTAKQMNTV